MQLVTAGEAFDDFIFYDLPRLPRPGEELKTDRFARTPGGGVLITAVTAARAGVRTRVITAASDLGAALLKRERIALTNLRRAGEDPAISVAISAGGERSFVTYNGVNAGLEPRLLAALRSIRPLHLHLALFPAHASRWLALVRALQARGTTVSWDFGWNPALRDDPSFARLLSTLDLVMLNEAEARLYSGTRSRAGAERWWRNHAASVVIKQGAEGAIYLAGVATLRAPAPRVRVVDTTGAGDAFNGGFLGGFVRGADIGACLAAGNRAGAACAARAGGIE